MARAIAASLRIRSPLVTSVRTRRSRRWRSRARAVDPLAQPALRAADSAAPSRSARRHQPLPMETNPRKVFYGMFGQGDTADERSSLLAESGSVLDYVMQSSASLQKKLGGDRSRIAQRLSGLGSRSRTSRAEDGGERARTCRTCRTRRSACRKISPSCSMCSSR